MENSTNMECQDMESIVPLKSETDNTVQKLTTYQKLKYIKQNVTVEPSLAFFMIASMVTMLAVQNLNLDKACKVNLKFNNSVCTALIHRKRANYSYEEDEVQKLIASVEAWKSAIHTAFPILLIMFIGAWSDKTGRRKICMLMPIGGELFSCVFNVINTYFFEEISVELTAFMSIIFPSLTGTWYTMFLGSYRYLVDITSKRTRTFRLGVLSLGITIGIPIGTALSGILLRYTGYYGVFGMSGTIQLLNFLYIYFFVEDHMWLANNYNTELKGCIEFFLDFFNFQSLRETLHVLSKNGPSNQRLKICLLLTTACLGFGSFWGETSIMYIFCRYRFNWDEFKYSIYSIYSLIIHATGTILSISIFSKKLKFDDSVLGIMATTSKICGALVWAFARNSVEIYLAPLLEFCNGMSIIAVRSIASKLVSNQELGKVYALFGLSETVVPLIFGPLYSRVYIANLHLLPGAAFLISVLISILPLIIFISFFRHRNSFTSKTTLNVEFASDTTEK